MRLSTTIPRVDPDTAEETELLEVSGWVVGDESEWSVSLDEPGALTADERERAMDALANVAHLATVMG
jgi:hypothetical protein